MKKQILFVGGGLVILAGLYIWWNMRFSNNQQEISQDQEGAAAVYATNFSDPRVLVGYAQEVFAAKILAETGNNPQTLPGGSQLAHYQYEVEVLYNIKGTASGMMQVDIEAFEGARLVPGSTYVLAARHWAETEPWYYVGSPNAFHVLISQSSRLTNEELIEIVKKHSRTYELLNAYPNEILRGVDIQKSRTINSFQSLSEADKQAVYGKFQQLIPPRPVPEILPSTDPLPASEERSGHSCRDGIDNDKDNLTDRADGDCLTYYREDLPSFCRDLKDNDLDGLKDQADPDCAPFYPPPPQPPTPPPPPIHVTSTPSIPLPPENFAPSPATPTSTPPAPAPSSTPQ